MQLIQKNDRIVLYTDLEIIVVMVLQLSEFCFFRVTRLQFFLLERTKPLVV